MRTVPRMNVCCKRLSGCNLPRITAILAVSKILADSFADGPLKKICAFEYFVFDQGGGGFDDFAEPVCRMHRTAREIDLV